jgi:hypothetical protein
MYLKSASFLDLVVLVFSPFPAADVIIIIHPSTSSGKVETPGSKRMATLWRSIDPIKQSSFKRRISLTG